ncbi:MAG: prenyltransferase/squalene oxidase repeat-containing protein [Pirellulaceae bacterium]|nr:prenyltransferase/squalene oxidase repeat-containing protein [Pirellulaceae bacterium]
MRAAIQPATLPKARAPKSIADSAPSLQPPQATAESKKSWRDYWKRFSSLISSGLFHTLLIIILAIIAVKNQDDMPTALVVNSGVSKVESDIVNFEMHKIHSVVPVADAEARTAAALSESNAVSTSAPSSPVSSEAMVASTLGATFKAPSFDRYESTLSAFSPLPPMFAKGSLEGRSQDNRTKLALSRGGTAGSEKAVEAALVWLVKHQYRDGGWSMNFTDPDCPCQGQCTHSSNEILDLKRPSATGLALLSFLGAGYTHKEGKYKDEVYRGLMYLVDHIKIDKADQFDFRDPGQFSRTQHQMYEQGIATLAICEAYQMTHDPILKNTCQNAIDFIQAAQSYDGSWGYNPRQPGDLSIVGWQMMCLKSAYSSELTINAQRIRGVDRFLASVQSEGGAKYGYRTPQPTPSMTSIGLLMRLYRGVSFMDPRILRGAAYIADSGPSRSDVYFNYYATQLLFQLNNVHWAKWNPKLRDYLVKSQNQIGHEAGSWYFDDDSHPSSNSKGGRLYCTAMAVMALEVYYRYMPIYLDVIEQPFNF